MYEMPVQALELSLVYHQESLTGWTNLRLLSKMLRLNEKQAEQVTMQVVLKPQTSLLKAALRLHLSQVQQVEPVSLSHQ